MTRPTRIFVADRGDMLCLSVKHILRHERMPYQTIHARDMHELRMAIEACQMMANTHWPVLVLHDFPGQAGQDLFEHLQNIRQLTPMPLLYLGTGTQGWLVEYLFEEGHIDGFLHRADELAFHLPQALQALRQHQPYCSPTAAQHLRLAREAGLTNCQFGPLEIAILKHMALGMKPTKVAEVTDTSVRHVYCVLNRMRYLLGVNTTEALMVQASQAGLFM
ncbi:MAG: hypothetical protein L0154_26535 [Chloroflexi bacterium]|nr:hypothetical protein [Chloroflexota bacterium]